MNSNNNFNDTVKDLKIKNNPLVYAPDEDTFLIAEQVFKYAKGKCLEVGAGSGYTSIIMAKLDLDVTSSDINPNALELIKINSKNNNVKINIIESDLFQNIKEKFDTIVFNPPYLPESMLDQTDPFVKSVDGGKKGYEVTKKFIDSISPVLTTEGQAIIIFSSMTKLDKILEFIKDNALKSETLIEKSVGLMEKLYVLKIEKQDFHKDLEKKNTTNIKYFSCGRRGYIYTAIYNDKKIAIKILNPKSAVDNTIYEFDVLKKLNLKGIGSRVIFSGKNYFAYEFFEGEHIGEIWKKLNDKDKIKVFRESLRQLRILDQMKLNKAEMNSPYKHILVGKDLEIRLIDFERCKPMERPKNITQFMSYTYSNLYNDKFSKETFNKMIEASKRYSYEQTDENFNELLKSIPYE